ncbi:DUF4249 family protein [Flavilitoribacter nigricans]|uniref:DUF4249 family protein n=1 Tax=Flavilitoribacter nigricans (strain ATCC 23147 / DSM 23189 / NBRC 102662 / NCIMB 1420 / SS-2) TaxID=1122177 RepID=A0A2D0N4F7_FLAN2|nr:DUF4249 family protein [Flavilitoribacter nigricans]PHN02653.1 hypothetical protein CRP01_31150 [Flavilitoribacter nigricans DSM 23189 = NBRC 102662]
MIQYAPRFRFGLILLTLISLLPHCTTDFEIEAGGRDIPVVYGFIDIRDTAHYLRIERAFLSGDSDAASVAQRIDSLYYDASVSVQLEKVNNGIVYPLERVDGDQEGYPRQSGPFVTAPNILYKIDAASLNLQGGEQLRLIIDRGGELPLVSAETTVLSPIELVDNLPADPFSLGNYLSSRRIAWRTDSEEAEIFDVRMLINYRESVPGNPSVMEDKTLEWVLSPAFRREDNSIQVNYTFQVEEFYQFIGGSLEPLAEGRRQFVDLEIRVTGGGPEFSELITIAQANVGITSGSDDIPVYTNIPEGRGIFSSRTGDLRTGIQITAVSLDSLQNGIYTKDLGF